MLNPLGLINDGFMEFIYFNNDRVGVLSALKAISLFLVPGGTFIFTEGIETYRCKSATIINKNFTRSGRKVTQDINIDGEDLTFENYANYTILP